MVGSVALSGDGKQTGQLPRESGPGPLKIPLCRLKLLALCIAINFMKLLYFLVRQDYFNKKVGRAPTFLFVAPKIGNSERREAGVPAESGIGPAT